MTYILFGAVGFLIGGFVGVAVSLVLAVFAEAIYMASKKGR